MLLTAACHSPKKFIAYTEDLVMVIDRSELVYADDTQLIKSVGITKIQRVIATLQSCILDIHSWCASRCHQILRIAFRLLTT